MGLSKPDAQKIFKEILGKPISQPNIDNLWQLMATAKLEKTTANIRAIAGIKKRFRCFSWEQLPELIRHISEDSIEAMSLDSLVNTLYNRGYKKDKISKILDQAKLTPGIVPADKCREVFLRAALFPNRPYRQRKARL